jgi:phosphoglycerate dehydrogenase-like enzyme
MAMPPAVDATMVTVLAHFIPGDTVLDMVAPESDWLDIRWCHEDDDATLHRELPRADAVWHVLRPLSGADLRRGTGLRLVHKLGTGVNTIDVGTATELGIAVANMPGANAPSAAEGTVLLMLAAMRRLLELDRETRAGRGWPSDATLGETVRDIGACTVGLVGYGNIARRVEQIVAAMGARVLHTSTGDDGTPDWRALPELLAESDIVSLHLPLSGESRDLMNAQSFAKMKKGAIFVTTARGNIHVENAVHDALVSGHLGGAGLDVWEQEPPPVDHPLLGLENVILTQHTAGVTHESRSNIARIAALAFAEAAHGRMPPRIINPEVIPAFQRRYEAKRGRPII